MKALSYHSKNAKFYEGCSESIGMTVPHYLPMMQLNASAFSSVDGEDVETVFVIAPNHIGKGAPIQVSGNGFFWSRDSIEGDKEALSRLLKNRNIECKEADELIKSDHSASIQMPYIKQYFPNSRVVTILLSHRVRDYEIQAISDTIAEIALEKRIFIVASIDFSHYLKPRETKERDEETREIIARGNFSALRKLTGANIDCPEAMAIFLLVADRLSREVKEVDYILTTFTENGKERGASYFIYSIN